MKKLVFLFILVAPLIMRGQNLVSNPGFENLSATLIGQGQLLLAGPWQLPNSSTATPDLFNGSFTGPPATLCDNVDVPLNAGGDALAHGGTSYAGIAVDPVNSYYEYITVQLSIPLDPGEIYILDFWVLRADSSRFALNRFGGLLSTAAPTQGGSGVIPFTPQFESVVSVVDTMNWTHVFFTPYQALGGEQYLTIGFFRSPGDPVFTIQDRGAKNSGCSSYDNNAYYYIDDVSLVPGNVIFFVPEDSMCVCPYNYTGVLEATSNVVVTWTNSSGDTIGTGNTVQIPEDPSVIFLPGQEYVYYANANNSVDSIKVSIVDAPVVDLGPDTVICEGDSVLLDATILNAVRYTWSTGDSLPFIYAKDTGLYWVIADNCGCPAIDSVLFTSILPSAPVDIGEDSIFCFFNYDSLRLNAISENAITYLWSPTGETTPSITVKYEGDYNVVVTHENGCQRQSGFEVIELCPPVYFIPNAFTPDGDGINDIYNIPATNYVTYTLRIFDRFGRLIFRSEDPTVGWDGRYESKDCPIGVYTYKLNINGFSAEGEKDSQKLLGTFTLYR